MNSQWPSWHNVHCYYQESCSWISINNLRTMKRTMCRVWHHRYSLSDWSLFYHGEWYHGSSLVSRSPKLTYGEVMGLLPKKPLQKKKKKSSPNKIVPVNTLRHMATLTRSATASKEVKLITWRNRKKIPIVFYRRSTINRMKSNTVESGVRWVNFSTTWWWNTLGFYEKAFFSKLNFHINFRATCN